MSFESMEVEYGPLKFLKCCRYWPVHTAHLVRGIGKCPACNQEMTLVTEENEIQRLRHTATELAEGPRVRDEGRESHLRFLGRYFQWLVRGQVGPVPERTNGSRDPAATRSPWDLD